MLVVMMVELTDLKLVVWLVVRKVEWMVEMKVESLDEKWVE